MWTYEQLEDAWGLCFTFAGRAIRDKRPDFDWRAWYRYYVGAGETLNEILRLTPMFR